MTARMPAGRPVRRGAPRPATLVRLATVAVVATIAALSPMASYAGFSASGSLTGTVTAASVGMNTSGLTGLAATYSPATSTKISPFTATNSGTAPLVLSSVAVDNAGSTALGSVLGAAVSLQIWAAASCGTTVPSTAFATTMAAGVSAIAPSYGFAIPAGGSLALCAATTLTGASSVLAGQTMTSSITLSAATPGSSTWTTTDTAAPTARTFTQNVISLAPTAVTCAAGAGYPVQFWWWTFTYGSVDVSWIAPVGATVTEYQVFLGATQVATTTNTAITLDSSNVTGTGQFTVTIKAVVNGVAYPSSSTVDIQSATGRWGLARDITCVAPAQQGQQQGQQ